eukprot:233699-Amphidinium_carterae.1
MPYSQTLASCCLSFMCFLVVRLQSICPQTLQICSVYKDFVSVKVLKEPIRADEQQHSNAGRKIILLQNARYFLTHVVHVWQQQLPQDVHCCRRLQLP